MSSVEALIRKQEVFEETCYANFEKIQEIEWMVRDLKDHEEFETIQMRCEDICTRRDALREACQRRKEILQDSKAFQQLLLEMYEVIKIDGFSKVLRLKMNTIFEVLVIGNVTF